MPTPEITSTDADDVRAAARERYGVVPSFFESMNPYTGAPAAVYMTADATLMQGVLTPREKQVILLTMARYHHSRYDAVVHAYMAQKVGLSLETIDALLGGTPPAEPRLKALVEATLTSCEERGWLDESTQQALADRGVGRGALYEIFALIGMKTFSAFTEHMARPAIDGPLQAMADQLSNLPSKPDQIKRERLFLG
ncbi:carboxymuconolactone decarboxylase family protein [Salisaeta longa]|uniref:carboxymuconolactone decarboxylase family protein n=1 Tax=Salisaeta longa TaxID=503170 RepID=UPI0003B4677B|nr:carboxymuconolactone decarboxylase family protein [Salisaeta longa]